MEWGTQLSGRDRRAANNTVDGLLRLLYPDPSMEVPDDVLDLGCDTGARDAPACERGPGAIGAASSARSIFPIAIGDGAEIVVYCEESLKHRHADGERGGRA